MRKAIARGVETGLFGYTTGRPSLGNDGRYQIDHSRIAFERNVADDEIDLDSGFLILPRAIPEKPVEPSSETGGGDQTTYETEPTGGASESQETTDPVDASPDVEDEREVAFSFTADSQALFHAWNALANLADLAGEVSISARAKPKSGFDKNTLEYGVLEPLRELGLIKDD